MIGRLVLIYVSAPAEVVRRYVQALRPGGVYVAMEYEMQVTRTVPPTPIAMKAVGWLRRAFEAGGVDTALGARLGAVLSEAGLDSPKVMGVQAFLPPSSPLGPQNLAGIVRSLLPVMERAGIATRDEVDIETLEARLAAELAEHGAVVAPPTLVGAWARHRLTH